MMYIKADKTHCELNIDIFTHDSNDEQHNTTTLNIICNIPHNNKYHGIHIG